MQVNPRQSCTLDSLLGIPDSKRWRDSGFLEWNHGSQSPGFRTLQAKKKKNPNYLNWGETCQRFCRASVFSWRANARILFSQSYLGRVKIVPRQGGGSLRWSQIFHSTPIAVRELHVVLYIRDKDCLRRRLRGGRAGWVFDFSQLLAHPRKTPAIAPA